MNSVGAKVLPLDKEQFIKNFEGVFGADPDSNFPIIVVSAPARVNLLGDHIDYNGGFVFPCAIDLYLTVGIRARKDLVLSYKSSTDDTIYNFNLADNMEFDKEKGFANYINGCVVLLKKMGEISSGFQLYIESNIPMGSGLSSSAALEVATILAISKLFSFEISRPEIAILGKRCENEFLGLHSGIMDQFIIANAQKDSAMLLDTSRLSYKTIPFDLGEYRLVVINSCKPRSLVSSKYNERKLECEIGLSVLQEFFSISNLCELKPSDINTIEEIFSKKIPKDEIEKKWAKFAREKNLSLSTSAETVLKRVRHCVNENAYVLKATDCLAKGDLVGFGRLMKDSHQSLDKDYEVSGIELNSIVSHAKASPHCIGARMTGAGFSGCAIAVVAEKGLPEFFETVRAGYQKDCNLSCEFYICKAVAQADIV